MPRSSQSRAAGKTPLRGPGDGALRAADRGDRTAGNPHPPGRSGARTVATRRPSELAEVVRPHQSRRAGEQRLGGSGPPARWTSSSIAYAGAAGAHQDAAGGVARVRAAGDGSAVASRPWRLAQPGDVLGPPSAVSAPGAGLLKDGVRPGRNRLSRNGMLSSANPRSNGRYWSRSSNGSAVTARTSTRSSSNFVQNASASSPSVKRRCCGCSS